MQDAITIDSLTKTYDDIQALASLDLAVHSGVVHGVLGPNGAGKTTLIRILTTLLRPDAGRASVAGFDVVKQPDEVRYRIGLVGQHAALDEELSGQQNLELFGRLYHLGEKGARLRTGELLEQFDLVEAAGKPVSKYSGGMRRRLDLAVSLIMAPEVLFLDEPTTGLDPRGRAEVWAAVRTLVGAGTTVLLTTQYLDEADQLADYVSVIDHGRVVADGGLDQLKAAIGGDWIDVTVHDADDLAAVADIVRTTTSAGDAVATDRDRRLVSAPTDSRMRALSATMRALESAAVQVEDIAARRPTLDEVFLHLTGSTQHAESIELDEREVAR